MRFERERRWIVRDKTFRLYARMAIKERAAELGLHIGIEAPCSLHDEWHLWLAVAPIFEHFQIGLEVYRTDSRDWAGFPVVAEDGGLCDA